MQIEIPKLPEPGSNPDQEREKDPLFQQIRKMMVDDLSQRLQDNASPPSLSNEPVQPLIGAKLDGISAKEWHAVELMLKAARLLEEEASQALSAGNHVRAQDRAAVARRTRAETLSLLQTNVAP